MARQHFHHGEDGPACKFPTKRECDESWRTIQRERKEAYEQRQTAAATEKKQRQNDAIDAFIAKEWARMQADR